MSVPTVAFFGISERTDDNPEKWLFSMLLRRLKALVYGDHGSLSSP